MFCATNNHKEASRRQCLVFRSVRQRKYRSSLNWVHDRGDERSWQPFAGPAGGSLVRKCACRIPAASPVPALTPAATVPTRVEGRLVGAAVPLTASSLLPAPRLGLPRQRPPRPHSPTRKGSSLPGPLPRRIPSGDRPGLRTRSASPRAVRRRGAGSLQPPSTFSGPRLDQPVSTCFSVIFDQGVVSGDLSGPSPSHT